MSQPQVWPRRQEASPQQAQAEPVPIEGVERMNTVIVCPNQRVVFVQCNPYAIEVDRGNRNCYNCEGFGHLTRNCRNRGTENRIGESVMATTRHKVQ